MTDFGHIPVLRQEVIEALRVTPGGRYIDCTLGGGGHAEAFLEHCLPGGQLLGIDADPQALEIARARLARFGDAALLVNDNFANLNSICLKYDFLPVHGVLFDLGLSSLQLEAPGRGFSFQQDAPLDMRFSPEQELTAADIVNTYPAEDLAGIIREYGEERFSERIARRIMENRPVKSTLQLARIIELATGRWGRIHPATRTFQALRIAVNDELGNLEKALKQANDVLVAGGRLAVISYHSLEDRIVKNFMRQEARGCICPPGTIICSCEHKVSLRVLTKKVITPSSSEVESNPRSRSARMRVAECIAIPEEDCEIAEELCCSVKVDANGWKRPALLRKLRAWSGYEPVEALSQ